MLHARLSVARAREEKHEIAIAQAVKKNDSREALLKKVIHAHPNPISAPIQKLISSSTFLLQGAKGSSRVSTRVERRG